MPSGSMPLNGSSIISTGGSPSSAAAMPSRCRMPSENPPAFRRATACSPACPITSSTRSRARPWEWASHSRWLRAVRLGCSAAASSSDPTWVSGLPQAGVGPPADQRGARVGRVQAEDHPHRGGLPRTVGARRTR